MERDPLHFGPRIVLEGFHARKYEYGKQTSDAYGAKGKFFAPNKVKISSGFKGWRLKNDRKSHYSAEFAEIFFTSQSLNQLMEQAQVDYMTLKKFVTIGTEEYIIHTDQAQFLEKPKLILGHQPVRVTGPQRWFTGQKGFRLNLKDESLNVYGHVRGMVKNYGGS